MGDSHKMVFEKRAIVSFSSLTILFIEDIQNLESLFLFENLQKLPIGAEIHRAPLHLIRNFNIASSFVHLSLNEGKDYSSSHLVLRIL